MNITRSFFFALLLLAGVTGWAQTVLWESSASHGWRAMGGAALLGYDNAHVDQGTEALKVRYNTASASTQDRIESLDFLAQAPAPLSTGFSLRVYAQVSGSGSGQPALRLELVALDDSIMAGSDTSLALNSWTEVRLPAASVLKDFKRINLVPTSGSATGQFDLWIDNLRRDGMLFDGLERGLATSMQVVNIEGSGVGNLIDCAHLAQTLATPPPSAGLAYGLEWTGDSGTVEVQHIFEPALDLRGARALMFDVYLPAGTALPTIKGLFWDGANGYLAAEAVQALANNSWQSFSFNLTGIENVSGFAAGSVKRMNLILQNAGDSGRAYIRNVRLRKWNSCVQSWQLY